MHAPCAVYSNIPKLRSTPTSIYHSLTSQKTISTGNLESQLNLDIPSSLNSDAVGTRNLFLLPPLNSIIISASISLTFTFQICLSTTSLSSQFRTHFKTTQRLASTSACRSPFSLPSLMTSFQLAHVAFTPFQIYATSLPSPAFTALYALLTCSSADTKFFLHIARVPQNTKPQSNLKSSSQFPLDMYLNSTMTQHYSLI
jgi:hypothetical protein